MPLVHRSQRADDGRGSGAEASSDQPERWSRVKALFLEALQYPDADRSAFVVRVTAGDPDLRKEIESLLASDEAAASFAETPAAGLLSTIARGADEIPRLAPGTRLGAYQISSFIAAGGMGAVYRARHAVLGRDVAIKTVGRGLADDAAKRRLIREARHASLLTHPNICAIHDVGETDDTPYIIMEYVSGKSLGEIVRTAVPPLGAALEYGIQIAGALEHAHRQGIIHRDLKSSNVVVNAENEAIVLDFGLATRLPQEKGDQKGDSSATNPDVFAGTLSHMAPEVLRGERADARSDVWALGVLLYELATGELPFSGRTPFETSSAILGDPPKPMSVHVPFAFRLVIDRCLVKDPRSRYQHAEDVAEALDAVRRQRMWPLIGRLLISARRRTLYVGGAATLVILALLIAGMSMRAAFAGRAADRITTLAILPLENATGDVDAGYYADGFTDALISQLGAVSDIRVLSRTSTMRVARTAKTLTAISTQLGADVIVQGELRRARDTIAVAFRLVRPSDQRVLWSESHQRNSRDVLALEADVVRALAGAIHLTLRRGAREQLATVRAVSPEVYEAYLQGRYEWNKRTPTSLQLAIEHFTHAVQLDPTYAPAHVGLADCYNQLGTVMLGSGSPREYRPRAAAEAIKALQIDPNSAEAHAALGYVWHYNLRWTDAEREFRRAIQLNPSFSLVRIWYANLLMSRSRMKEAIDQVDAARELDPFSLVINTNVGWVLDFAGRHDDAVTQLRQTLALDSEYVQARWRLALALLSSKRLEEAREEASRIVVLGDSAPPALALLALIDAHAGRRDAARVLLRELLTRSQRQYVPPAPLAQLLAQLGEVDEAMMMMERAFAERSNAIAYLAVDPEYSPMRQDPRFESLLVRAGLK
jgi:TolB-like protein/Tfp pilus assembly protein PilF/tRNA A-37 threonylcarbamoyl transferase component Bud32